MNKILLTHWKVTPII